MNAKEFVRWLYPLAKQNKEGVSPLFIVAQSALESGWGKSKIGDFNFSNIVKGDWTGKTVLVTTVEFHNTPNKKYLAPEEILSVTKISDGKWKYLIKKLYKDYDSFDEYFKDYIKVFEQPHFIHAWSLRQNPTKFVTTLQAGEIKYSENTEYVRVMKQMFNTIDRYVKELKL